MGKHEEGGRDPGLPKNTHAPKESEWLAAFDPRVATHHFSTLRGRAPTVLSLWPVSGQQVWEAGREWARAMLHPPLKLLLEAGKGSARRKEMEKEWAMVVVAA
jgi:hypothetical protein